MNTIICEIGDAKYYSNVKEDCSHDRGDFISVEKGNCINNAKYCIQDGEHWRMLENSYSMYQLPLSTMEKTESIPHKTLPVLEKVASIFE